MAYDTLIKEAKEVQVRGIIQTRIAPAHPLPSHYKINTLHFNLKLCHASRASLLKNKKSIQDYFRPKCSSLKTESDFTSSILFLILSIILCNFS